MNVRLKWAGFFHRPKATPGRFMVRLKVPNGIITSEAAHALSGLVSPYGEEGCIDITTRANIQLRGVAEQRPV